MTEELKEAVREYLADHLTVEVSVTKERDWDYSYTKFRVSLLLEGKEISSTTDTISQNS